jgi:hypothetical protein
MSSRLGAPLPDEVWERWYASRPDAEVHPGHERLAILARGGREAELLPDPGQGDLLDDHSAFTSYGV